MKQEAINSLVTLSLFALLAGAFAGAGESSSLADRVDAIIVKGKTLPSSILGASCGKYRLFAQQGSKLSAIPFQIDEYDPKGNILMKKGPKVRPDSDNEGFDANDELVFMAWDASEKVSGKPSVQGCDLFVEIAVIDAKKGSTGYVYIARCSKPPSTSSKKYVNWDAAKLTVTTARYRLGFQRGNGFYYDYLSIFNGPNLLDRQKVRVAVGKGNLRMVFNEDNFKSNIQGYIDGPVRAVFYNLAEMKMGILGSLPSPTINYFYRHWAHMPTIFDNSFNPAAMGLDFEIVITHDFKLDRARGYKICTNSLPNCAAITGRMTPELETISKKETNWGGIQGPEGAMITRFVIDPRMHTKAIGFYLDDDKARREPEYIPGSSPEVGFMITDWKSASKGVFSLDFYHYFMKKYSVAEVERFDRLIFAPLQVKTKLLK